MSMSYKEKSLIASMGVTLLLFGWYFYGAFSNLSLNQEPQLSTIIALIVLVIISEGIIQSFLALKNKPLLEDERDKLIEKISYRYGYWFLSAGIWFLLVQILLDAWLDHPSVLTTPNAMFHFLLLLFVLAEFTNFVAQLYHHRKRV